jgi:hypothetical protein
MIAAGLVAQPGEISFALLKIRVNDLTVRQIEGDSAVNLCEVKGRKRLAIPSDDSPRKSA